MALFRLPLTWRELARRVWRESWKDDVLGLAAELAFFFFLALLPAMLFLLALASFFPLDSVTSQVTRSLRPFVSPQVIELIKEQMSRLAENESGGVLTFGVLGAIWSSSTALVSITDALNHVYEIEEARSWWRVRLIAIGLTLAVALLVLVALSLVLGGSLLADLMGHITGWGAPFRWAWLVLQWPLVFALMTTALGLIYHVGPDADQDWAWMTPGTAVATVLWVVISLLFKTYIATFTNYEGSYGTVGGVMVVLLWFYMSGLAILIGAEVNAEIEHAQPHAKVTRLTNVHGKVLIGQKAARALARKRRTRG